MSSADADAEHLAELEDVSQSEAYQVKIGQAAVKQAA